MKKFRIAVSLICVSSFLISFPASSQGLLERFGLRDSSELSESVISDGLREALTVGAERTIEVVSKQDGYLGNKKIKIPLPDMMRRVEAPLRRMGHGEKVDDFILSMNRAAEAAAPIAKEAMVEAISRMTVEDAKRILKGRNTAATDYLSKTTRESLLKKFKPIIQEGMNEYAVSAKYDAVISQYDPSGALTRHLSGGIEDYTANKALDGLFFMIGQEEKRIRNKPAARTTDLLKKVFE